MITADERTAMWAAIEADPRVHVSATGSWLDAEAVDQ